METTLTVPLLDEAGNPAGYADRIARLFAAQRAYHPQIRRTSASERIEKLKRLRALLLDQRPAIRTALRADFGKSAEETDLTELIPTLSELKDATSHLKAWMRPSKQKTPLTFVGTSSKIYYEPKGVVLIISPWNYPLNLTLGPLVSAVAAGNCVMIKPSEFTPNTSTLMQALLAEIFPEEEVAVFQGDHHVAQALLEKPFDHIFFTGSPAVGKLVMRAAADHLSGVTLELGGKSPTIVDETADVAAAAKKIVWGKYTNAGQTCIAPDYVYVHQSRYEPFLEACQASLKALYGDTPADWKQTPALARIINDRHHDRLRSLLDDAIAHGAALVAGGQREDETNYFAPTILRDLSLDSRIMEEEIFGPLMPVLPYETLDEPLAFINRNPKPLTLYIFSEQQAHIDRILAETSAGTTAVNDTLIHFTNPAIPFGGVGNSGLGKSHGRDGFLAFSNRRPVMVQKMKKTAFQQFYPPFTSRTRKLIDFFIKYMY